MAITRPLSTIQSYEGKMREIEYLVHTRDEFKDFSLRKYEKEIAAINDVRTRFWLLSHYYALVRDRKSFEESVANLRGNNYRSMADLAEFQSAVVNGDGEKINKFAKVILKNRSAISWVEIFIGLYLTGQFSLFESIFREVSNNQDIKDPDLIMPHLMQGLRIARKLNSNEEFEAKRYSLFGEVLKSEGLYWATDWREVKSFDTDRGGPQILLQYGVYVNAVDAARLNRKISKVFAENDLVIPGFVFRVKPGIEMTVEEQMAALEAMDCCTE